MKSKTIFLILLTGILFGCNIIPTKTNLNTITGRLTHDVNSLLEEKLLDGEIATWHDREQPDLNRSLAIFFTYFEKETICRDYFTIIEKKGRKYSPAFGTSCRISSSNWEPVRWSQVKMLSRQYEDINDVLRTKEVKRENKNQAAYDIYLEFKGSSTKRGKFDGGNYVYPYRLSPSLTQTISGAKKKYGVPYHNIVEKSSKKHNVNPILVYAVIKQESNYNPKAKSWANAQGLMQLMPGTARELGVKNAFNPYQNVDGGTRYLRKMLNRPLVKGEVAFALASYNCGYGNVKKHIKRRGRTVPPCRKGETRDYVKRITKTIKECAKYN
ncbi:lytic transglycosylase domain-containing protein [Candidatus Parabeggiatoa sp. HSG14]|uniref:lytic transglycosylase domain-containing protein n=1 Tax=Candidatus Parabeggiatoa sp. HSG14 TaxID=3055593 RepID=UPI0025A7B211|nr:lytic transglycosylase domain-containing protein [Thiotrichales bacterium HSG14]